MKNAQKTNPLDKFTNKYSCSKKILGCVHEQQDAAPGPAEEPG